MRLPIVLAAVVAVVFLAPGPAGAAADPSVPVAVHSAVSVRAVTAAEAGAPRAAINSACRSYSVSQWATNVFGGILYRVDGTVSWCYDTHTVWSGSNNWKTSTGFGWGFDHWNNPPNGYYNRPVAPDRYDTVAQARFCLAWCAGTANLGHDIWGLASGGYGWQPI